MSFHVAVRSGIGYVLHFPENLSHYFFTDRHKFIEFSNWRLRVSQHLKSRFVTTSLCRHCVRLPRGIESDVSV
ncbi:hypothetical protein R69608_02970 [Paraburkholderia nemoris]|nr:hypothetical protein R69608_02970 [Paraburkholderia nemoris]